VQTASPQDLSEVSTKHKKSGGKGKPDSPKVESSPDLPVPISDEFIPAPPKARGKKKPENALAKPRYILSFRLICVVCYSGNTYEQLLQAAVDVDFCGCVCFMHFSWGQIACVSLLFLHHFLQGYSLQMFAQVCAISAADLIQLV